MRLAAARPLTAVLTNNTSVRSSASGVKVIMAAALARLGLRAVKQVRVQFCPFEKNVESTRYEGKGMGSGRDEPRSRQGSTPRPGAHAAFPLQDLPPGGEQRESPRHQPQLLGDCRREARRLRALRGRAVRWACVGSRVGGGIRQPAYPRPPPSCPSPA